MTSLIFYVFIHFKLPNLNGGCQHNFFSEIALSVDVVVPTGKLEQKTPFVFRESEGAGCLRRVGIIGIVPLIWQSIWGMNPMHYELGFHSFCKWSLVFLHKAWAVWFHVGGIRKTWGQSLPHFKARVWGSYSNVSAVRLCQVDKVLLTLKHWKGESSAPQMPTGPLFIRLSRTCAGAILITVWVCIGNPVQPTLRGMSILLPQSCWKVHTTHQLLTGMCLIQKGASKSVLWVSLPSLLLVCLRLVGCSFGAATLSHF